MGGTLTCLPTNVHLPAMHMPAMYLPACICWTAAGPSVIMRLEKWEIAKGSALGNMTT